MATTNGTQLFPYSVGATRLLFFFMLIPWFLTLQESRTVNAEEAGVRRIAVVVSQNIKPYLEAVDGVNLALSKTSEATVEVVKLWRFQTSERPSLAKSLLERHFDLYLAIGPEAFRFLWNHFDSNSALKLYSIVLNPQTILGPGNKFCGIPLNIPVQEQLRIIAAGIPNARKIGLLYDPSYNEEFFKNAANFASMRGIEIVPLKVDSRKEIPSLLKNYLTDMDALWLIPDRTVISESIVRYVIKEAFIKKVPTIGYNRFFYESGALMAFIFNYQELGGQAAQKVLAALSDRTCSDSVPLFQVWINKRVAEKLERNVPETILPPFVFGP